MSILGVLVSIARAKIHSCPRNLDVDSTFPGFRKGSKVGFMRYQWALERPFAEDEAGLVHPKVLPGMKDMSPYWFLGSIGICGCCAWNGTI